MFRCCTVMFVWGGSQPGWYQRVEPHDGVLDTEDRKRWSGSVARAAQDGRRPHPGLSEQLTPPTTRTRKVDRTMTDKERQEAMAVTTPPYASDALAEGTVDAVVIG